MSKQPSDIDGDLVGVRESGPSINKRKRGDKRAQNKKGKLEPVRASGTPTGSKIKTASPGAASGRAWTMGSDPLKGRIMVATRDLEVGEVILNEQPLVAASWHEHRCLECHEPHAASTCKEVAAKYPKTVAEKMDDIEEALGTIDGEGACVRLLFSLHCPVWFGNLRGTFFPVRFGTFLGCECVEWKDVQDTVHFVGQDSTSWTSLEG